MNLNCLNNYSKNYVFTLLDFFLVLLSFGSFLVDVATDIIVVLHYYRNGHIMWMILTSCLVCVPSLMVQVFSFRWLMADEKITKQLSLIHILQLGLFYRFIKLLQLGFQLRKTKSNTDLQIFNQQQSDMCMLRLFESFTESAPQLVLQLYIMITTDEWSAWTGISALASIVSLSWGISAYSKAMRNVRPEKKTLSWWGLLFQALWRIGMVSSRIIALVLFAVSFGHWLIIVFCLHWFAMTLWVFFQKTDFCSTWWEERLYNCVVGVIYCFCFFNLKEGKSRYRISLFYSLTVIQNIVLVASFYFTDKKNHHLKNVIVSFVPGGIIIGLMSMLLYYRFFHPSGSITLFAERKSNYKLKNEVGNKTDVVDNCSTLKTSRKLAHDAQEDSVHNIFTSENLETSIITEIDLDTFNNSVSSVPNNNTFNAVHLRRHHSFDFSWKSFDIISDVSQCFSRKTFANHHRNINYHFRRAAAFGIVSSKTHCSCLVLVQNSQDATEKFAVDYQKMNISLPNLEHCNKTHSISSGFILSVNDIV